MFPSFAVMIQSGKFLLVSCCVVFKTFLYENDLTSQNNWMA